LAVKMLKSAAFHMRLGGAHDSLGLKSSHLISSHREYAMNMQ